MKIVKTIYRTPFNHCTQPCHSSRRPRTRTTRQTHRTGVELGARRVHAPRCAIAAVPKRAARSIAEGRAMVACTMGPRFGTLSVSPPCTISATRSPSHVPKKIMSVINQCLHCTGEQFGVAPGGALRALRSMGCLLYTSPSPRDLSTSRMPSSA